MTISNLLSFDLNPWTVKDIFKIFKTNSLTLVFLHADCLLSQGCEISAEIRVFKISFKPDFIKIRVFSMS